MKVKNIMFSGFAAAILMGVAAEANAAAKVVASKGYVDSIAGSLDALTTEANDNLVLAINELNSGKQAKFTDGAGGSTTTGFISSVTQSGGAVTAGTTAFDTEITADDSTNTSTAPTSAAVYTAIQGVSGQTTNLDLDAVGGDGKFVKLVSQADGQVSATATEFDTEVTAAGTDNTAPTTAAVYTAIQGVSGQTTNLDLDAVGGDGKFVKLVSQADGQVSATATEFDTEVTAAGTDNTAPTTAAVYTAIEGVRAEIPDMPAACSASGVTCVLTSENGAFVWAILAQPYSYQSGTETNVQRMIDLGYAAQDQKIPEQLYTQQ